MKAATPRLARATGEEEIREWARESLRELDVPAPPPALAAVRRMAVGPTPDDPADGSGEEVEGLADLGEFLGDDA